MHFELKDIEMEVHLGCTVPERTLKQTVLISLAYDFDEGKATTTDALEDTFDYSLVYDLIKDFPQDTHFHLMERLHTELKQEIQKQFPQMGNLVVSLQKFSFADASITIRNSL